ncbi:MAG TPA: HD domain-containing phosphohydrolase [Gemmatimonadales bacterium]|nr:HD domain-containing phosphohydrolase [Gemmatimonadales bacterium]
MERAAPSGPAPVNAGRRTAAARFPEARILVIDDEPLNLELLEAILQNAGYGAVQSTTDPRHAGRLFQEFRPDVIMLDLHMPGLDGFGVLELLRPELEADRHLPVIMLTGDSRTEVRQQALSEGARDFLVKPFDAMEVLLRLANLLETRFLHLALKDHNRQLEGMVLARTRQFDESQLEVLERLASAAEFRDDDTGRHTQRVATLAETLALATGLAPDTAALIRRAAPLHDVGKIGIPDQVLLKPGRLTQDEFAVMRTHTTIGAQILAGGQTALIQLAERIARSHHERWDGGGYPDRLAGEAIPLEARIVALADFFDALTHVRPYRPAWPLDQVMTEIDSLKGRHFDPALAEAFLKLPLRRHAAEPNVGTPELGLG